jgi:ABC-type nitrate/sulfonate/bicarbonate transport system substrate-binding protein
MGIGKINIEDEIVIGYSQLRISLPIFVAKRKGLFKKYGLKNVRLSCFDTAQKMLDSFVNNEIKIGGYCALPIAFNEMSHNSEFKLNFIGGIYEDDEHIITYLIKRKGIDITDLKELENFKIGYFPTSAYEIWLIRLLKSNSVNYKEENLIKVDVNDQYNSLDNGEIDFLLTNDPIATKIFSANIGENVSANENALVPDVIDINPFYFGSFIIDNQFSIENPKITKAISKALDEAIGLIRKHNYKSYLITESLSEYLNLDREIIQKFSVCNFRKTNEIKNKELDRIREYYHNQSILLKKISTQDLQYSRQNIFGNILLFYYKYEELFKKRQAILVPLGVLLSAYFGFMLSNISTEKSIESQVQQFEEQLMQERKSIPAQFLLRYDENEKIDLQRAHLVNIGYSTLINISADIEYYFVSKSDFVYLASNLYNSILDEDFIKLKQEFSFKSRDEIMWALNDYREVIPKDILMPELEQNLNKIDFLNNGFLFDNSSSIIATAIKINKTLETKLIARWKISFFEEISREKKTIYKFIWFTENSRIKDKFKTNRVDLTNVTGGGRIIELINDFEKNTKEIIFKE